jgi:4-diphosphocytidyl-2-C-methyl-D-erythritol kinase
MGGGSADGAAVLVGLNHLCGNLLSIDRLKGIASRNGADIPFCIDGGTQRLNGIGTDLVERYSSPKLPIVIVKQRAGISTPAAYRYLDSIHNDFLDHMSMNPGDLLESLRKTKCANIGSLLYNRFEEVLEWLCIDSLQIISWLKARGCYALLSGSGTAVFGIANDLI